MAERDEAWQRFFEETETLQEISQRGYCYVTADDLKLYGQREPRLMAKIDTLAERPRIFKEQRLSIFPTRNGMYILFRDPEDRTYYRFGDTMDKLPIQEYLSSVDLFAFDSFPGPQRLNESQAIDFAYISGLLQHFTGDSHLQLAIRGRAYSNAFRFALPVTPSSSRHTVDVSSVQIEIDAGYESSSSIYLIEAKVGRRDDFNIRQLYYPYLEWSTRSHKRIVPIFLVYTNGITYLTELSFAPEFGDLRVVRSAAYVVNDHPRPPLSLSRLLAELPPATALQEPAIPYPQANDLDKVLDVVAKIEAGMHTKQEIADAFEFDVRQGDYYANAACYLGVVERQAHGFGLTTIGANYLQTRSRALRNEIVARQLLMRPTYRQIFERLQQLNFELDALSNQEMAATIAAYTELSGSTPARRAQTMRSWLASLLRNAAFQE